MRRDVLNLIAGLASRNLTMMIVTHEMSFARDVSDRIFFMEQGKIIEQGKPLRYLPPPPRVAPAPSYTTLPEPDYYYYKSVPLQRMTCLPIL